MIQKQQLIRKVKRNLIQFWIPNETKHIQYFFHVGAGDSVSRLVPCNVCIVSHFDSGCVFLLFFFIYRSHAPHISQHINVECTRNERTCSVCTFYSVCECFWFGRTITYIYTHIPCVFVCVNRSSVHSVCLAWFCSTSLRTAQIIIVVVACCKYVEGNQRSFRTHTCIRYAPYPSVRNMFKVNSKWRGKWKKEKREERKSERERKRTNMKENIDPILKSRYETDWKNKRSKRMQYR